MAMKPYFPLSITGAKNKKKSKVFHFIQQHIFLVNFDSIIPTNKEDPMGTLLSYYRPTKKGETSHLQIPHVFWPKNHGKFIPNRGGARQASTFCVDPKCWTRKTFFFAIWSTVFYDDSESAREAAEGLLDALGWRFARDGKKALPFSERFNVLGVCMDLSQSVNGLVTICNKDDRVDSRCFEDTSQLSIHLPWLLKAANDGGWPWAGTRTTRASSCSARPWSLAQGEARAQGANLLSGESLRASETRDPKPQSFLVQRWSRRWLFYRKWPMLDGPWHFPTPGLECKHLVG